MDHIQLPDGGYDHLEVPYVSDNIYNLDDFEDFDAFPTRLGFPSIDDHAAWLEVSATQIASLAQSWLYFGLVAAFLNQPVDLGQFVLEKTADEKDGPIRRCLSSLALVSLLDEWIATGSNEGIQEERLTALLKTATEARSYFSQLPQAPVSHLPEILLSINILITTLGEAVYAKGADLVDDLSQRPHGDTLVPDPVADLLARELLNAGWCPFNVVQIMSDYSYLTIYYLSRLRNPMAPHITHAACTKDRCIGNNVDMATYSTRHTEQSCKCPHSSVPENKMRSIIADGGIPIVRVKATRNGTVRLEVKRATHRARYIAISHVWSDGLGNPNANSLPECQLKQLSRSIKRLMPPMDIAQGYISLPQLNLSFSARDMAISWGSTEWFWLDTLCIPVGADAESILLKSRAINQMAAIYAGAHQVLVLDSVMQAFNVRGRDACHLFAQMSALAWLGRCWTYQEGALTGSLQVQCADCSFDPTLFDYDPDDSNDDMYLLLPGTTTGQSSWHRAARILSLGIKRGIGAVSEGFWEFMGFPYPNSPRMRARLFRRICGQLRRVVNREMCNDKRDSLSLSGDTLQDFVLCWNSLAQRTTTMGGDIHVIVANLLRLNAFTILGMSGQEERMQAILWSLPGIPLSLLFNQSEERVRPSEHHANRWMPLWPDRHRLKPSPIFDIKEDTLDLTQCRDGYGGGDSELRILLLNGVYPANGSSTELIVSDSTGLQISWYRLVLSRQPDDEFDSSSFQATAFMLQPQDGDAAPLRREILAACLHISGIEETIQLDSSAPESQETENRTDAKQLKLKATFDCPAKAWFLGSSLPSLYTGLPRYEAKTITRFALSIQHDVPTTQSPLPQRPQPTPFLGVGLALMLFCSPFNLVLCAMTAILVYEHVSQQHEMPSPVLVASYLAIISHSYTFLAVPNPVPVISLIPVVIAGLSFNLIPFIIGLVYVGLKIGTKSGETTGLDKAVVGLLICGHVPQLLVVALARWYVNVRVYKAWLETYAPEWAPNLTDPWLKGALRAMEALKKFIK
ncbi:hypothetical protein MMYC01_210143 [Madurella mycetomatis]|uniref:Heterokaryon incompatibility domain-containing protein n=1 Tax=Madurella mycetomatis TaxID=100816 RepID=A0A175VQP7_9PEZI|nr:hypothetical protein MMYC01_210143 [Madurella mycetomatis]